MLPSDAVTAVKGIGPARAADLARAGIETVEDLLLHLPFRYEDRSAVLPVADVEVGGTCALEVTVERCRRVGRGRGGRVEATVGDGSRSLRVVWFNQPYVADNISVDDTLLLFGRVTEHDGEPQITNPVFEKISPGNAGDGGGPAGFHIGRLVPIYRRIGSLSPGMLRRLMMTALDELDEGAETLPGATREALELVGRKAALRGIHAPGDDADLAKYSSARSPAHRRLICEEFLSFQTALQLQRSGADDTRVRREATRFEASEIERVVAVLPFALTDGQRRAVDEILADMQSEEPMHRLLQGDVGCGKTAVAACALFVTAGRGFQGALMAPTEILARQHAFSLAPWAASLGLTMACLTASTPTAERREMLAALAHGELSLLLGTHALLEPGVRFAGLRLVVVDEQHRFGVQQRAALRHKGTHEGVPPDLLVMTATPIPRTLALTVYGDLDVHAIKDMPPGRQEIVSRVVSAREWGRVVTWLGDAVRRGEQAYVVAPRIEAGDDELAAAVRLEADLARQLPDARVGLLHGALNNEDKAAVMRAFAAGDVDVLAATTVVEVGVDVANATLMVVGHAESFGLAQLHQLRGRVGRGPAPSTCVFIAHEPLSPIAAQRLETIRSTRDGFVVAEKDLALRGPGEVLGMRQAGFAGLRVGDPFRDHEWLEATRSEAERLATADDRESMAFRERARAQWERRLVVGAG